MTAATTAILYAPGTNCHEETAAAIERAGGKSELVLLHDLVEGRARLADYQAAIIPGGFAYGDHLGAGRIFGVILVARLRESLIEFLEAGKPLLGICNGFQVLAEAGILPGRSPGKRGMALLENASARFEDRKINLVVSDEKSPWTEGLEGEILRMPTAHGEGRPMFSGNPGSAPARVAFRYSDHQGKFTSHYPENPNGAPGGVAGLTDLTGTVLGLMPHPERASLPAHYSQDGLRIFKNLIRWLSR
ncbi:MAG: phosphoribosylformylglycinamidine synthase I [Acidobacteria bacterium]|nr:MAG: phosphoribosylformylglycinamidine synthase I [Acidobacteriota bacterium]